MSQLDSVFPRAFAHYFVENSREVELVVKTAEICNIVDFVAVQRLGLEQFLGMVDSYLRQKLYRRKALLFDKQSS